MIQSVAAPLRDPATLDDRRRAVGERLAIIRELMEARGSRGALFASRRGFAWLTAGGANHVVTATEGGVAPLLVTRDEAVVLAPTNEEDRVRDDEVGALGIAVESVDWWRAGGPAGAAEERLGERPVTDTDLEPDLVDRRSVLAPFEIERLAALGEAARAAVETALAGLEPGRRETELEAALLGGLEGIHAPVVLVAGDDRIARYRHPLPVEAPVRRRVMLVLVAERWGLHAALTRFRDFEPRSDDLARRFAATEEVQAALHEATRPGATLGEVFEAGQRAYARVGFADEWRLHHQGGTIGFQGRERVATPGDGTPIAAGMAFAWNPSIAGAKAEETFVLQPDGGRRVVTAG